ncbi:MAG: hypothetical protein JO287_17815 [Pseudonocardiales bacterium]|nr:hypothetical protein [Pseudonocardiales bacterium]
MAHSRTFITGLALAVLLALADLISLAAINTADSPPAVVVIAGAALGLITLIGVWMAWRRQRGGRATVVVSRLLSMALGIPVYFVDDVPDWARVAVTIVIVLTLAAVGLLYRPTGPADGSATDQRRPSPARP